MKQPSKTLQRQSPTAKLLIPLQPTKATLLKSLLTICAWTVTTILLGTCFTSLAAEDLATPAAENPSMPWEKGSILFGGFVADFSSDVVFGIEGGGNRSLNTEDLLGLHSTLTSFRAGALYRPGASRRNQLDFSYASYRRDGNATLSREVEIDGETYPIGAQIDSVFNFDIINGTYSYAFWQTERLRLALGLGIYAVPLKVELNITTTGPRTVKERIKTTLPLPALSFRGEYRLVDKLFLNGSVEGMYMEVSDFTGYMVDLNLGIEYRPWKHVGFGLGYNFLDVDVTGKSSNSDYPGGDFVGEVGVRFSGLIFYGKLLF
jgi:hypothetical protein